MDKHTQRAFEKLEKREHLLRAARDQRALGRITPEMFRKKEAEILERYALTAEEEQAYNKHNQKRKSK
ncbi:hypothetical protein [Paenibacillus senegalensis]|uniref:hypothetical protein n=1 Tax=Paenibacillus senegalensis TaxID=1465766 RepID=UPI000287DF2B|nr:hypothetical protein [Paenibacillus senegalensis]